LNKYCDDYNLTDYSSTPSPDAGANLGKRKRHVNHTPSPPISESQNRNNSKTGSAKVISSVGKPPAFPRQRKAAISSPYESSPFSHLNIEQEEKRSPDMHTTGSTLTKNGIASETSLDRDGEFHRSSSFDKSTPKGLITRSVTFGHLPSYRRSRGESDVSIESALSGIEVKQESNSSDPSLNPLMYLALLTGEVFGDGITSPLKVKLQKVDHGRRNDNKENYDSNLSQTDTPIAVFSSSPDVDATSPEDNLDISSNSDHDSMDDYSIQSDNHNQLITPRFKSVNQVSDDDEKVLMVYSIV
jgi:hypothetical protein